ncbi:Type VI secretion protein ImpA [Burkholderia sp. 8Y]|uniref:type VI secretion system protein TssA n=1 Tax=Burkholderia sp. 8Y TaxID=2653133 RepID=UPI0012F09C4A|nr:type VI secretion system ImpA family N-terminal domain-containing protein [Burkholderia sp. 8Y]VXB38876.1 Type VI secretion protein ImpA [Burkholderia sp. 8Y]
MSNTNKQAAKKAGGGKAAPSTSHDWMTPIDAAAPCGADLEYDPEFVVLSSQVAVRPEAQYGDFVGVPEPINWSDVDRDCRRLMMRSKDMRLAVLFTRCRTRLAGAPGLAEGLGLLAAWLDAFAEAIHPRQGADDDEDAALEIRMNALQALTDTDGLLSDVREIALTRSSAVRLQMRDVERAFAHPRPSDALAPESVTRQIEDLRLQQPDVLAGFDAAAESLKQIGAWGRGHLDAYVPDLSPLARLLDRVVATGARVAPVPVEEPAPEPAEAADSILSVDATSDERVAAAPAVAEPVRVPRAAALDRQAALELIREARHWFEQHEPSSPIPVLLRRAELFVGKRYAEVVKAISPEMLEQWEGENGLQ